MEKHTEARKLDVRGEICPYPMMRAVEALKKLPSGDALEVLTDHAPALGTIPWEAAKLGYDSEIVSTGSPEWRITLTPDPSLKKNPAAVMEKLASRLDALGVASE